jgi:hypothetical protein
MEKASVLRNLKFMREKIYEISKLSGKVYLALAYILQEYIDDYRNQFTHLYHLFLFQAGIVAKQNLFLSGKLAKKFQYFPITLLSKLKIFKKLIMFIRSGLLYKRNL